VRVELQAAVGGRADVIDRIDAALVERHRRPVARVRLGLGPGTEEIGCRGRPRLPAHGVMREGLDVVGSLVTGTLLESGQDAPMQETTSFAEERLIGDLLRQGVLEGEFELREEARLVST